MKLPGVGRKTANVVLNNAFGQHTIGVDTHVFRVSNRLGLAPGKTVEIESIWGEPLKRGKEMSLMMPELEKLYTELLNI